MKPHYLFAVSVVLTLFFGIFSPGLTAAPSDSPVQAVEDQLPQLREGQTVLLDQTPLPIQDKVRKESMFSTLKSLTKGNVGGYTMYEAEFETTGGGRSKFHFAEDGSILSYSMASTGEAVREASGAERAVAYAQQNAASAAPQMPAAVQATLQEQLGEIQVEAVQPARLYNITLMKEGRRYQARVAEDGTLLGLDQAAAQQ